MANFYKNMMDKSFGPYYELFRKHHALSEDAAVTKDQLFPNGQTATDREAMHKMLSHEVVKRVNGNQYWLDESIAEQPNGMLKKRLLLILLAVVLGVVLGILKRKGVF